MPDAGVDEMAHFADMHLIRFLEKCDSRSMDVQRDFTPPLAPALKKHRVFISRGRKENDVIMTPMGYKGFVVNIRPPKWKDSKLWITTADHQAAQYVTDAAFHYIGRPPVHYPGADFRYPPLSLNTGEYLTTREECYAYVTKIAKDSTPSFKRREYKECVQRLVLDAVKSPEVVHFLNCVREDPCQGPSQGLQFHARRLSVCGKLDPEDANSELETYSTPAVDVEGEHWKPMGFDVKEAAMLPRIKQYFPDDHDLGATLLHPFLKEEDDKRGIVLSNFSIPSSASPSTIVRSLVEAPRSWRSQRKKTLLLKLLPTECDQFLYPSLKEDSTIHQVEASDMMLVQDLLAHVQPEQVEEASFVSSYNWKTRHRILDPVVADLPSSADCLEKPGDEPDSESEAMDIPTDEEGLSGESGASLESHTEIASADSHCPRTKPSRKRSAASAFYDDNLFAQIRSYVNQQIEEALLPLMSALRSREEDEHKHRQKMLALEQEKLALMRQQLECTHRSNAVPANVAK